MYNAIAAFVHTCRPNPDTWQLWFSVAVLMTCVFNLLAAPSVVYEIDDWSDALSTSMTVLQSRVVAVASLVSRGVVLYHLRYDGHRKYRTTLESCDVFGPPATAADARRRRLFAAATMAVCLASMVSANGVKLYNLYHRHPDGRFVATYFLFFYVQNCSIYLLESRFADQCFVAYTAFRDINCHLADVVRETVDYGRFPFLRAPSQSPRRRHRPAGPPSPRRVVYEKDFHRPRDGRHPLANTVEYIKIRHWLVREAVVDLNRLYRVHLAISVVSLSVLMLFDVYTDVFRRRHTAAAAAAVAAAAAAAAAADADADATSAHGTAAVVDVTVFRSKFLLCTWLVQYSFRFLVLAFTSNATAKQAINSKTLINDMNNRFLDNSTKEELQLFYNQVAIRSTEINIYGLFTLNTRLITSAIAAGATYLIVLLQLHSHEH